MPLDETFLNDMADEFGLTGADRFVFVKYHLNQSLSARDFYKEFQKTIKASYGTHTNEAQWVSDKITNIKDKLLGHGLPRPDRDRPRLLEYSIPWLEQEKYPEWLDKKGDLFWSELWNSAELVSTIHLEVVTFASLRPKAPAPKPLPQIVSGQKFYYQIEEPLQGSLIFLGKDKKGIYGIAPSPCFPNANLDGTSAVIQIPDQGEPLEAGEEGEEDLLLIVLPEVSNWQWLGDKAREDTWDVKGKHLKEILDAVKNSNPKARMLKMTYQVVSKTA